MRSILFLSDSANRRMMRIYSESGLKLPNLERLMQHSVVFDNHWTGSSPCMPARRDIMTGRLNFLERGWGPIEPFDVTLPRNLREYSVDTFMITDHYHYFEIGGENYCQMFNQWEFIRGQERDPQMFPSEDYSNQKCLGKRHPQYFRNREVFRHEEERYPSAITIDKAAQWLEENHDRDNFFLWIEPFDPHEPFEVPQKYLDMMDDHYEGMMYLWPNYDKVDVDAEALAHVRKRYCALMLMVDHWMGRILDVMDRHHMWDDTAFIYTTDHGYMLGEHDFMAKNYMPAYNEVFHIPLMVHLPGDAHAGERIDALTQNIDLLPTLLELHGAKRPEQAPPMHGRSLLDLIEKRAQPREYVIYGCFGKAVNITDGRYTYFRAPRNDNKPLYMYTAVPIDNKTYFDYKRVNDIKLIDIGRFLPWTDYPVFRIPASSINNFIGYALCYNRLRTWEKIDYLFDLENDYAQEHNIVKDMPETVCRMEAAMARELVRHDAPMDHFLRLDLIAARLAT